MNIEIVIVLAIMAFTIIMLVTELFRIDVAALLTLLLLTWTGVLTSTEALSGFSSNAVVAMIAVMIMGEGIARTGVMTRFSKWLLKQIGSNKNTILGALTLSVGSLSGFMQNIGAVAIFLPSVFEIARRIKVSASALVMPVGFAAIIGGTLTMVGSGHLILTNDLLISAGLEPYSLFAVTPVGIVLLLSALIFFLLWGKHFLPQGQSNGTVQLTEQEKLVKAFNLKKDILYYRVPEGSQLAGLTIESSGIWKKYGIHILAIAKNHEVQYAPWRETLCETDDVLALYGDGTEVQKFVSDYHLQPTHGGEIFDALGDPHETGFAEMIVPPRSELVGQTIRQFTLRKRYAVEPILLFSRGEKVEGDFSDHRISAGDTFIVYGTWEHIRNLNGTDTFVVTTPPTRSSQKSARTWQAALSFVLAIVLVLAGFSIPVAFLTGAVLMVLTKVLTIQEAYKAVEWKVVFLLVGLIPLGVAMQKTGAAAFLAEHVMGIVAGHHLLIILFTVALLSTIFSLVMSNVGAVVVLAPLVVSIGQMAGIDPRPLVLLAAINAGNSFILPTHQVNALMMTAGGYRTIDYIRAGGGVTILFLIVSVLFFHYVVF